MHSHSEKEEVAISSVVASAALTVGKLVVGLMTGSMGIVSEAAHSLLDWVAAGLTWFAVHRGDMPADETHPYGHGKVESVSALIETGLLFVTSAWIIYESINRLVRGGVEVEATWYAFVVVAVSIAVDWSRSRALSRVAKRTNSQALEADALHFSSDIWSSTVVLLGLVLVRFGLPGADAIAAIGVAVFVAVAGYRLGKRTIDVLVDTAPAGAAERARAMAAAVPGVVRVERTRVRSLGANFHVEAAISVNRRLSVERAQAIVRQVEEAIEKSMPGADVVVHARSVQLDTETVIEAVQALAARKDVAVHDVIVDQLDGRQYVSYDLEVPDDLTVRTAHEVASRFEQAIKEELGEDVELNSHIEPLKREAVLSSNVAEGDMAVVLAAIKMADADVENISDVHNVLVRKIGDKFFVSLHCRAPGDLNIETVHHAANRFEYLIQELVPGIKRVVIHVEPK